MDPSSLAGAIVAAQAGQLQLAVVGRLLRMDANMQASTVKLISSGEQNLNSLANVAAGIGTSVDVTA